MSKGTVDDWVGLLKFRDEKFQSINYSSQQEKYILTLGIRVTELCLDAVILIDNHRMSSAPIVLRSALESYADLRCCIEDVSHPEIMTKAQYWRFHELHKHTGNPSAEKYKRLGKKLSVWERFIKSDLIQLYNGYYSVLSMHSHGNVGALVENNSKDTNVVLGSNYDDERALEYFDQAINLVALTIKDVLTFYNFESTTFEYPQQIMDKINKDL